MRRLTVHDRGKLIRAQIEDPPKGETRLHVLLRLLWPEVDPAPFVDGRHLHAKCEALHSLLAGDFLDLVINEPPGSCKSMLLNVFFPAYIWLVHDPSWRMLFASYGESVVNRDAGKFIELLRAPVVQAAFPEFDLGPEKEKKALGHFYNRHKGFRKSTSIPQGQVTGEHFHIHTYDDPIKPAAILAGVGGEFQTSLNKAHHWIGNTAATRFIPTIDGRRIMMMQRLHESDPAGRLLKEGGWEHLCFPEEFVPNATWIVGDLTRKLEWRKEPGELLWPERRDKRKLAREKKNMGAPATIAAQLQQNPTPDSGGILEKGPILQHAYRTEPDLKKMRLVASFDFSFKEKRTGSQVEGSRVVGQLWGQLGGCEYLLRAEAGHMGYRQGKDFIRAKLKDPEWSLATFLIEDKANGSAIEDDLKDEFPNLRLFEPGSTNKLERMLPFVEPIKNGRVRFPHPELYPWAEEVIDEIVKVPRGTYDDHWDGCTQALMYLQTGIRNYSQGLKQLQAMGVL